MLKSLPPAKLNAPLIVYDGRGGEQAVAVAKALVKAGQQNVLVLNEGMIGWQAAAYPIESGTPALTKIAYAPKPRAGSIPMAEFTTLATKTPADVLILDVRNADEAVRRHDQGCAADSRRGTGRTHGRGAQGQAHRHALPDRHPRRDGLPQAQGSGLQRRVPEQRHRRSPRTAASRSRRVDKENGEGLAFPVIRTRSARVSSRPSSPSSRPGPRPRPRPKPPCRPAWRWPAWPARPSSRRRRRLAVPDSANSATQRAVVNFFMQSLQG